MRDRRFKKDKQKEGGSAPWMTTFSDMMSLLLSFFILLYSMSSVDAVKFRNISHSLQGVLSGLGYTKIIDGPDNDLEIPQDNEDSIGENLSNAIMQDILAMYEKVTIYVDEQGLDAEVTVNMDKRGVFVDIKDTILFEPGSAAIKDDGLEVLEKLKGIFNDFDNEIVIEGHTDDVPMNTARFPSNWELSTGRAVSVLRYLAEEGDIAPERLSATGFGEYRPIAKNDSSENRSVNRRVNILIIFDEESDGMTDGRE